MIISKPLTPGKPILGLIMILFLTQLGLSETIVIKFATVAPRNSSWMNSMVELDRELQERTEGTVRFKFYPGGVQGDEQDVLRKIRIDQLHAGGFTGVGMGAVNPDSRILDLPFLFNNSTEVDQVTEMYHEQFVNGFRQGGFELLGWTEVGLVRFFTSTPIHSIDDIKQIKLWVWQDDPLARLFFRELGVAPIPLALPDVLSGLETGLINAAYASPYAGAVLQWHTQVDHVSQMPVANAAGAILISQERFTRLSSQQQTVLLELCARYSRQITLNSRRENQRTLELFSEQGISLDPEPVGREMQGLQQAATDVQQKLAGELYNELLFKQIQQSIRELRGQ